MIKSILLVNWRSHANSKLDFRDGTNLLVGIMGAGKSSVLESISFALFGTFPSLERRKVRLEDLMRLNEPITKVFLEFECDDTAYRIERIIEKNKRGTSSSAEIFKNGNLVESGPVAVNAYIQDLLQIDYDLFTRAIYSEQNNIDYFLTLDPRRRKQEVDILLGLDKFEIARTNVVSVIGRIRSKREGIEERFNAAKLVELSAKEQAQDKELADAEGKLKLLFASYDEKSRQIAKSSGEFDLMKKKKEQFEMLSRDSIRLAAQKDSLKAETATFDEQYYSKLKSELASLIEEKAKHLSSVRSLDEGQVKLSREVAVLETKIKACRESSDSTEKLKRELESLLAGKKQEELVLEQKSAGQLSVSYESEKLQMEKELLEISGLLQNLKPGISECPLCSSKLGDAGLAHIKAEKNSQISRKKARLGELSALLPAQKKKVSDLETSIRRISILSERIAALHKDLVPIDGLLASKTEAENELVKIKGQKLEFGKALDELVARSDQIRLEAARLDNILSKRKSLEETEKKLLSVNEALRSLAFNEGEFEVLRAEIESMKIGFERLSSQKRELETSIRMASDMLKVLRDELAALRLMETESKYLIRLEGELLVYKNALLETQTSLRQSVVDAINGAMNEIWKIFYPYRNYSALRLEVSERDYLFQVNDGQNWKPLESIASGGERACAALTLRVALATVLAPKLSWLVLDEPTHNLDRQAIELLSLALQFKVPEIVRQTFVITHEEALIGSDFASSYRLSRDKENNKETVIERI